MKLFKRSAYILAVISLLCLSACATNSILPTSPEVELLDMKVNKFALNEQGFVFTLDVNNTNRFDIPVVGLNFVANINGIEVTQGQSDERFILAAQGHTQVPLRISVDLFKSFADFTKSMMSNSFDLDYHLKGKLLVDTPVWPLGIPYSLKGNLLDEIKN